MTGLHEPLRQREPVERRVGGQRRQHGRHAGADLLSLITIVTALEHERVARFLHLGHHHGGRNLVLEIGSLFLQRDELAVQRSQRVGRDVGQEILADVVGLLLRALAGEARDDHARPVMNRELLDLIGRQDPAVEPKIVDRSVEGLSERLAAHPQRRGGAEGSNQRVLLNVDVVALAVNIEPDAGRFAGTVVGQRDLIPLPQPETVVRADSDGAARVGREGDCQLRRILLDPHERHVLEPPLVATTMLRIVELLKDAHRQVAAALQPHGHAEGRRAIEGTDIPEADLRVAVERRRLSDRAIVERRVAGDGPTMLVSAGDVREAAVHLVVRDQARRVDRRRRVRDRLLPTRAAAARRCRRSARLSWSRSPTSARRAAPAARRTATAGRAPRSPSDRRGLLRVPS